MSEPSLIEREVKVLRDLERTASERAAGEAKLTGELASRGVAIEARVPLRAPRPGAEGRPGPPEDQGRHRGRGRRPQGQGQRRAGEGPGGIRRRDQGLQAEIRPGDRPGEEERRGRTLELPRRSTTRARARSRSTTRRRRGASPTTSRPGQTLETEANELLKKLRPAHQARRRPRAGPLALGDRGARGRGARARRRVHAEGREGPGRHHRLPRLDPGDRRAPHRLPQARHGQGPPARRRSPSSRSC